MKLVERAEIPDRKANPARQGQVCEENSTCFWGSSAPDPEPTKSVFPAYKKRPQSPSVASANQEACVRWPRSRFAGHVAQTTASLLYGSWCTSSWANPGDW